MQLRSRVLLGVACLSLVALSSCRGPAGADVSALSTTSLATTTTTLAPTTTTTTTPPPPTTAAPGEARAVLDTQYRPFAEAGGLVVRYPTARVERVGFHESKLAGARPLSVVPGAGETLDMPTRDRATITRGAADILSDPNGEVRAPVTGRVKRGGTYTLYCKYTDSFLVIEPDDHPGWEVKLLHINGLMVRVGQRVEGGVTVVAAHPTRLPFHSQVEDYSAEPVWTHVHLEIDDPSIKNPPGVGGQPCS